jgi:hypothetical protein
MSQSSLLQAQSSPTSRPTSTKSGKQNLGKTLKHAFSRRKRSGSLRVGNDEVDLDGTSQRSGSIGPESFLSNEHSITEEPRMSEDVTTEQRYILPPFMHGILFCCTCRHTPSLNELMI